MTGLSTSELAKRAGINLASIRFYERQGLLPKPPRTPSGYRMFPPDSARRVRFIKRAQELGFTLKEIKQLLALRLDPDTSCADVRRRAEAKLADIDQKIRDLKRMKATLARLAAVCPGQGATSDCPILESLDTDEPRTAVRAAAVSGGLAMPSAGPARKHRRR
ncbi:MerR family transcriptional regulator [Fontivita pretiosa]|uniref:MerR family transcriptional regulator n=1 Tax=Fontivita pretiosa TaxID=2989684 RepID=UPI003D184083